MAKDAHGNKIKNEKPAESASGGNSYGLGAPSMNGGMFSAAEHVGRLLLISPTVLEKDIQTTNGIATATRANVVVLDGQTAPLAIDDALIWGKVIQPQLTAALNSRTRVVGRLFIDTPMPGKNGAFKLSPPTEADIKVATSYLDSLDPLR